MFIFFKKPPKNDFYFYKYYMTKSDAKTPVIRVNSFELGDFYHLCPHDEGVGPSTIHNNWIYDRKKTFIRIQTTKYTFSYKNNKKYYHSYIGFYKFTIFYSKKHQCEYYKSGKNTIFCTNFKKQTDPNNPKSEYFQDGMRSIVCDEPIDW